MEEIHQTHLSNIISFLHRKSTPAGFKPLENAIQIQLRRIKPSDQADITKKLTSICTRCFTYWKEGNFSVKFKPKYKHGKNISKRMVLKCLACGHKEYQSYNHNEANVSKVENKIKPITKAKNTIPFKSKSNKNTAKLIISKTKTKTKNTPGKNKSKKKRKKN